MKSDGLAAAVLLWARSELRRRWTTLVMLGVLAGLAAGLAIATVDGAMRTESSYERMRSRLVAADAVFFPSQVGFVDADLSTSNVPRCSRDAFLTLPATTKPSSTFPRSRSGPRSARR